jgi:RNA polymerase sigma-70 factor, ECF subfamily
MTVEGFLVADYSPSYPINGNLDSVDSAFETFDEQLVEALRAGSEDAYESLIQRFQHPVYNLVCRLLDDSSEAPDVLQEVFLKVFRKIGSFRGQSSLKTWIYRIAVNEAYNQRRFFSRHRKQEVGLERTDEDGISYQEILPDQCRSPFEIVAGLETQELVSEALKEINPSFRAAVVLRDIEEMSYEEVAEVLQVNLGTVKSRILRGREALGKKIASRLEKSESSEVMPSHLSGLRGGA